MVDPLQPDPHPQGAAMITPEQRAALRREWTAIRAEGRETHLIILDEVLGLFEALESAEADAKRLREALAEAGRDTVRLNWMEFTSYELLKQNGGVQIGMTSGLPQL